MNGVRPFGTGEKTPAWKILIDKIYDGNAVAKEILLRHSRAVAELALSINRASRLGLDNDDIIAAAMLHDVGIIETTAPGIGCNGKLPYIAHGIAGGKMIRKVGLPEWLARIAERHTGSGLTEQDIKERNLPLPLDIRMVPETKLEKLICYSDKFFSKRPGCLETKKTLENVRYEISRYGEDSLRRFDALHASLHLERPE